MHLITGLNAGGAEHSLIRLLACQKEQGHEVLVVSLADGGDLESEISARLGVPLFSVGLNPGPLALLLGPLKVARQLRNLQPDVLQTWMYHSDLLGGLGAQLAGKVPVFWNIRQSNISPRYNKKSTIMIMKMCALLSTWLPKAIVSCSQAAAESHIEAGYKRDKLNVVPNGYDTRLLCRKAEAGAEIRAEFGVSDDERLVGIVARFDPAKDHRTFIRAAERICKKLGSVKFLMVGANIDQSNHELMAWIKSTECPERFIVAGYRENVRDIYSGLDLLISSSVGEGFPNAVAEAMACEVPCVVTDVGDSALLVGNAGLVVRPGMAEALSDASIRILSMEGGEYEKLRKRARKRVVENFSIEASAQQYEQLYKRYV